MPSDNPAAIEYIGFSDSKAARHHQSLAGGWIFTPEGESGAVWFDMRFTPTTILSHRATRGISGHLS